ncbi:MAG: cyclic nucleotide-binding/CBS domain-containing protein [Candidatus Woesearchaeota archaeon]
MPAETVKDIMTRGAISVQTNDKLTKAIKLMTEKHISCVMVLEKEQLVGIITERDLIKRVLAENKDPKKLAAQDAMTRSVSTISEEATLEEAMRVIESMKVRRLPVVNKKGLSGLITQTDIVNETYSIHKHNQKMAFHQNLQSYIIIATVVFFIAVFVLRLLF